MYTLPGLDPTEVSPYVYAESRVGCPLPMSVLGEEGERTPGVHAMHCPTSSLRTHTDSDGASGHGLHNLIRTESPWGVLQHRAIPHSNKGVGGSPALNQAVFTNSPCRCVVIPILQTRSQRLTPRHLMIKMPEVKDKEFKSSKRKTVISRGVPTRRSADFSRETFQARKD